MSVLLTGLDSRARSQLVFLVDLTFLPHLKTVETYVCWKAYGNQPILPAGAKSSKHRHQTMLGQTSAPLLTSDGIFSRFLLCVSVSSSVKWK